MSINNYYLSIFNHLLVDEGMLAVTIQDEAFLEFLEDVKEEELEHHNQTREAQGLVLWCMTDEAFIDYFSHLTRRRMSDSFVQQQCSVDQRREQVVAMHSDGWTITEMSRTLNVSYRTVQRDFVSLGLTSWTDVTSERLRSYVEEIIRNVGPGNYIGRRKIAWYLLTEKGIRASKASILRAMRELNHTRPMSVRRVRRAWYEALGPDGTWSIDQNEKIGMYGFKFLAVIDGYSRYPIYWKLVTDLTGKTHSRFFYEAVSAAGGVPIHTTVDAAAAWNGVKPQLGSIYPDINEATELEIDGAVGTLLVLSSVHNTY